MDGNSSVFLCHDVPIGSAFAEGILQHFARFFQLFRVRELVRTYA